MSPNHDPNDRFDQELRRVARAMVTEELPRGVLDPTVSASLGPGGPAEGVVRPRRALPGFAALAASVVVLLLATAVALAPGSPFGSRPSPSPSPTATPSPIPPSGLRTSLDIRADLLSLLYSCTVGRPLSTIGPGPNAVAREAVVCTAPAEIGPFIAAVIVGESADGRVVEVHAKADFTDGDTPAARQSVAVTLGKAAAVVVVAGVGNAVAEWVVTNLPAIEPDDGVSTEISGLALRIGRTSDGGYVLSVGPGGPG